MLVSSFEKPRADSCQTYPTQIYPLDKAVTTLRRIYEEACSKGENMEHTANFQRYRPEPLTLGRILVDRPNFSTP